MRRLRNEIGTAWVPERVLEAMILETTRVYPLETGGVLLGYWVRLYTQVVVTHVVGPGPLGVHHEHSFDPDHDYHASEIARIYSESGRLSTYLGDWHSHPDGRPNLSHRDKSTMRRISRHAPARAPIPLMAVMGTEPEWALSVWAYFRRGYQSRWRSRILPLRVESSQ